MQGAINSTIFVDTVAVFGAGVIETSRELSQRDFIRRVAINLIGARQYEYGLGAVLAGGFQEIERTY